MRVVDVGWKPSFGVIDESSLSEVLVMVASRGGIQVTVTVGS
jgi:hypothetical protein